MMFFKVVLQEKLNLRLVKDSIQYHGLWEDLPRMGRR